MAYGTLRADTIEHSAGLTVGTVTSGLWNATTISGQYGGTGVDNSGKTITLGGNLTTSGAYACTLTLTGTTNVTLPTSGTLATTASVSGTAKAIAIGLDFIFGF
jgi:hypothetical protein